MFPRALRLALAAGALITLPALFLSPARAASGEIVVGAQADWSRPTSGEPAWAAGGWAAVGLGDTWALLISGFMATHAVDPPQPDAPDAHVAGAAAGLEYAFDVLEVTPFFDLQVGALYSRAQERSVEPQVAMGAGVDWIFWRHGSVGVAGHWNEPLTSGTGYFRVGPRLALRWP